MSQEGDIGGLDHSTRPGTERVERMFAETRLARVPNRECAIEYAQRCGGLGPMALATALGIEVKRSALRADQGGLGRDWDRER